MENPIFIHTRRSRDRERRDVAALTLNPTPCTVDPKPPKPETRNRDPTPSCPIGYHVVLHFGLMAEAWLGCQVPGALW